MYLFLGGFEGIILGKMFLGISFKISRLDEN